MLLQQQLLLRLLLSLLLLLQPLLLLLTIIIPSGYVSEHRNPVPQRYRSEHSMRMRQLFLVCCYFRSNMAAEHVIVIFGLKVEDAFDSFEELQTKIEEIDDR